MRRRALGEKTNWSENQNYSSENTKPFTNITAKRRDSEPLELINKRFFNQSHGHALAEEEKLIISEKLQKVSDQLTTIRDELQKSRREHSDLQSELIKTNSKNRLMWEVVTEIRQVLGSQLRRIRDLEGYSDEQEVIIEKLELQLTAKDKKKMTVALSNLAKSISSWLFSKKMQVKTSIKITSPDSNHSNYAKGTSDQSYMFLWITLSIFFSVVFYQLWRGTSFLFRSRKRGEEKNTSLDFTHSNSSGY